MQSHSHIPQFAVGTLQQWQQWPFGRGSVGSGCQAWAQLHCHVSPPDRDVRNVAFLPQAVTLPAANIQPGLAFAPARVSTNNMCSRPIHVVLLSFIPALRRAESHILRAEMSPAALGSASALECCSPGRTARGITSQQLFESVLILLTEGLSYLGKRNTKGKKIQGNSSVV